MSEFRTIVEVKECETKISHHSGIMFLGSCFAENIGDRLVENRFHIEINPFGIIYNPLSIANSLDILIENKKFTENDLFFNNDQWNSFFHHSRFSNPDKQECLNNINSRIETANDFLKKADYLFITIGTSWVYEYIETKMIVSNCHKIPAGEFNRLFLSTNQIIDIFSQVIQQIRDYNFKIKIIFSISPIRHLKDTAEGNMISKATLLVSVYELNKIFGTGYFPAYEIMMDDLRDYRFYDDDKVHPSKQAIDYIWEKFANAYLEEESRAFIKEFTKIHAAVHHRPVNEKSEGYQAFLRSHLQLVEKMQKKYPGIDLSKEKAFFGRNTLQADIH